MTKYIFADTSAFIAMLNKRDQYHTQATKKLNSIEQKSAITLLTTTHVFAETVTRIQRKISVEKSIQAGNLIRKEKRIEIINPQQEAVELAWEIYGKYHDQKFSFVDCISFAVMQLLNINKAFAFDKHFMIMGFKTL